jgi:hypothetical protein
MRMLGAVWCSVRVDRDRVGGWVGFRAAAVMWSWRGRRVVLQLEIRAGSRITRTARLGNSDSDGDAGFGGAWNRAGGCGEER